MKKKRSNSKSKTVSSPLQSHLGLESSRAELKKIQAALNQQMASINQTVDNVISESIQLIDKNNKELELTKRSQSRKKEPEHPQNLAPQHDLTPEEQAVHVMKSEVDNAQTGFSHSVEQAMELMSQSINNMSSTLAQQETHVPDNGLDPSQLTDDMQKKNNRKEQQLQALAEHKHSELISVANAVSAEVQGKVND